MIKTNKMFFGLSMFIIALGAAVLVLPMTTETCAAGGACIERAGGGGTLVIPNVNTRIFSFSAEKSPNGTVMGKAQVINKAFDFVADIDIKCLEVVGNRARVAGVVVFSTDPNFNNNTAVFEVFDNGNPQGTNDTNSLIFFSPPNSPPPTPAYCQNFENFPQQTIGEGNIQVEDCP